MTDLALGRRQRFAANLPAGRWQPRAEGLFMTADPFDLQRFVDAQDAVFDSVLSELRQGRKRTHWMWFIFPQYRGLGGSPMSETYAISSLDEAAAYSRHPVLGDRLRVCTDLVNRVSGRSISEIFGFPDDLKFRSSMTLFAHAAEDNDVFLDALSKYFSGEQDPRTLELIGREP